MLCIATSRGDTKSNVMTDNLQVSAGTIIREPELLKSLEVSRVTVWRWVRDGKFPRPVALGANSKGWIRSEVAGWLAARMDARETRAPRLPSLPSDWIEAGEVSA
jgi:prophage regulatory protein